MADPFEALGGISDEPPLSAPGEAPQRLSVPRPGWPGMSVPPAGTASFPQQHHQPQYPSSLGNSSHFAGNSSVGFHQQNIMGRANSTAAATAAGAPRPQPLPGASAGYPVYPLGQQQQQQQHVTATAPATTWSTGTASQSGMFQPTGAWKQPADAAGPYVYTQQHSTGPTAAAATPEAAQHVNTSSGGTGMGMGGVSRGGAEWMPSAEQMVSYRDMWATASAGCPVPGTVSGRAAVQFFSRSGLPKDALKAIWSLCDPSLTGCIRQPGFFAAMRLIAIAQQDPPTPSSPPLPTVSALEATRFAPLPLPRMEGFTPPSSTAGAGGLISGSEVPLATGPATTATGVSDPYAAAASTTLPSRDGLTETSVGGGRERAGTGDGLGGVGGAAATTRDAAAAGKARGVEFPSPSLSAWAAGSPPRTASAEQQLHGAGMSAVTPAAAGAATAGVGVEPASAGEEGEEGEDDFGDFAGAQGEAQPPVPPTDDDGGDDFGDFAGAPASVGAQASATAATAAAAAPGVGDTAATSGGSGGDDVAWMMEDGDKGAASSSRNGGVETGTGGGLDDLIKSNLHAATAGQVHLADMQSTPPLLGKAHGPVMVDRASVARSKLTVFDEMADLDLAVGQEDWNDFADETTAPPRSPTPPPPAAPNSQPAAATGGGDAVAGVCAAMAPGASDSASETHEAPQPLAPPREGSLGNDDSGGGSGDDGGGGGGGGNPLAMAVGGQQESSPFSPFEGLGAATAASDTEAAAPLPAPEAMAEGQDSDWGDFEDASGRTGSGDGAAGAGEQDDTAAPGAGNDDEDEEWGTFTDAPATVAVVAATGGIGSSNEKAADLTPLAGEEPGGGGGSADSPRSPRVPQEAVDPFAEIAPSAPAAYRPDGEVASPGGGDDEETTTGEKEEDAGADGGVLGGASGAPAMTAGLPLSLRGLRDVLARHGRLEEAVEVQQRMELPSAPSAGLRAHANVGGGASSNAPAAGAPGVLDAATAAAAAAAEEADGGGGEEDRDLERWRAAAELPPAATVDELAETISASDPARAERFRARFVDGRPPVEEEALTAGGGAAALAVAVRRQRAARRAVYLSSLLGAPSDLKAAGAGNVLADGGGAGAGAGAEATDNDGLGGIAVRHEEEGGGTEIELEVGFGLDSKGARPPPTLSDWALMTAHVTRMAKEGLAALEEGGGGGDCVSGGETTPRPASPTPPPPPLSPTLGLEDAAGTAVAGAPRDAGAGGTGTAVSGEVVRSEKFEAFARGLREAVKVCRMTQAAAEDACLEGVAGFTSMEHAWAELRRSARAAIGDADEGSSVFGVEGEDDSSHGAEAGGDESSDSAVFRPSSARGNERPAAGTGGGGGGVSRSSGGSDRSVEAVREECVRHAPDGSALCAVSLQPLATFGGSRVDESPPPPGVVEYCGVRYAACAVNLWVNVLDKPPPGPLP